MKSKSIFHLTVLTAVFSATVLSLPAEVDIRPAGFTNLQVLSPEGTLLAELNTRPIGPRWRNGQPQTEPGVGPDGTIDYRDDLSFKRRQGWRWVEHGKLPFACQIKPGENRITFTVEAGASEVEGLRYEGVLQAIPHRPSLEDARLEWVLADETRGSLTLPASDGNIAQGITAMKLTFPNSEDSLVWQFDRPVSLDSDRSELRIWLMGRRGEFRPGTARFTLSFPSGMDYDPLPGYSTTENWFPVKVESDFAPDSLIGLHDWLGSDADQQGWMGYEGKDFVFADGTKKRFWGTNLSWGDMAPPVEVGERLADRFAKYGLNLVRYHKFLDGARLGTLLDLEDHDQFDEDVARRFDRFFAELVERGIHIGWSPIYIYKPNPSDRKHLLALDEILAMKAPVRIYTGTAHQLVNVAPDLQDLYLKRTVDALNRTNPITSKRYAEDPALAYIELRNEDMIFKDNSARMLDQCPTYRKQINRLFAEWLLQKYGSESAWRRSWGDEIQPGESLAKENTRVLFVPQDRNHYRQRELDSFQFLYEFQNDWYQRYAQAIRDTGYEGAIIAGCWQSQYWLPHLYNLHADYLIGPIDRHNYMRPQVEMISMPGQGLIAAGIQQVVDRPFSISEWASKGPWSQSMNTIIAAYGMGLQGWDFSGLFSSRTRDLEGALNLSATPGINETADAFSTLVTFPALARMVLRGDVAESEPVSTRRLSLSQLHEGKIGYDPTLDLTNGAYLMGSKGSVPSEIFGIGKTVIEFTESPPEKPFEQIDLEPYWDRDAMRLRSVSGQLEWDYSDLGFIRIDTDGTAAVVGSGGGQIHDFKHAKLRFDKDYASIFITAMNPADSLQDDDHVLITVAGRFANEGGIVNERANEYLMTGDPGGALLAEPVRAEIILKRKAPFRVTVLDHEGHPLSAQPDIPVAKTDEGYTITLDGASTQAFYYHIDYTALDG